MTQGQWMKGCPEGGEQSFLFGLYSELSEGDCNCPNSCLSSIKRKKSDFFAIFVSHLRRPILIVFKSLSSVRIFHIHFPAPEGRETDLPALFFRILFSVR